MVRIINFIHSPYSIDLSVFDDGSDGGHGLSTNSALPPTLLNSMRVMGVHIVR